MREKVYTMSRPFPWMMDVNDEFDRLAKEGDWSAEARDLVAHVVPKYIGLASSTRFEFCGLKTPMSPHAAGLQHEVRNVQTKLELFDVNLDLTQIGEAVLRLVDQSEVNPSRSLNMTVGGRQVYPSAGLGS